MTLKDIEKRLEEIGIYEFVETNSIITTNPKKLKIVISIDFKVDIFGDDCDKFWDFLIKNSHRSKDTLMMGVPKDIVLGIVYENSEENHNNCKITYYEKEPLIGTKFFLFLNKALKEYLNKIKKALETTLFKLIIFFFS